MHDIDDQVSVVDYLTMLDENKVPTAANWMLRTATTTTTAATSGTARVTSMRLPGSTKNNVMVYLDDMSVCHSRTASDISVTK